MFTIPQKFSGALRQTFNAIEREINRLRPVSNPAVAVQQTSRGTSILPRAAKGQADGLIVEAAFLGSETADTFSAQRLDNLETITVNKPRHLRASTWNPGWQSNPGGAAVVGPNGTGEYFATYEHCITYRSAQRRYRVMHWPGYVTGQDITEYGADAPDVNLDFIVIHEIVWPPYCAGGTDGSNGSTSNDIGTVLCLRTGGQWLDLNTQPPRQWVDEATLQGVQGINDFQFTYTGLTQYDDQTDGSSSVLNLGT